MSNSPNNTSKPRDFRGINVFDKLLGKVRPTDPQGVDVTEEVHHSIKATIVNWWESAIANVRLSDDSKVAVSNTVKVDDQFSGTVYENQNTASSDGVRAFTNTPTKLRDVVIKVTTYSQYFGSADNQRLQVAVDGNLGFTKLDLSTLYFKNVTAGQNGVVTIIGVRE